MLGARGTAAAAPEVQHQTPDKDIITNSVIIPQLTFTLVA
jgi:hypothetical protein